ncbi:MAG: hypothetical protein RQ745_04260 [Longimicrobiales bacterium]|nr:hypothetical protein [Longimicrobiales bacterium]
MPKMLREQSEILGRGQEDEGPIEGEKTFGDRRDGGARDVHIKEGGVGDVRLEEFEGGADAAHRSHHRAAEALDERAVRLGQQEVIFDEQDLLPLDTRDFRFTVCR